MQKIMLSLSESETKEVSGGSVRVAKKIHKIVTWPKPKKPGNGTCTGGRR